VSPIIQPVAERYNTELYYGSAKIFRMLVILRLYINTAVVSELHVATWHHQQNCLPQLTLMSTYIRYLWFKYP